ncbi:spore coat protein D [Sporosarcina sp. resist]|uniref:spore coat protein D n=1 Tax=Sporosarcina sp. resist TaxID=2762563 RepID=UPI0021085155|nr:spore coat protein D [Sporosarcina sp. resist]
MMQQGNWQQGNQMQHGNCGGNQVQPIVCPTQYRCHDRFVPREVPFIHPIVNVNRVHTVEIPRHYFTETTQNVMGQTIQGNPCGERRRGW